MKKLITLFFVIFIILLHYTKTLEPIENFISNIFINSNKFIYSQYIDISDKINALNQRDKITRIVKEFENLNIQIKTLTVENALTAEENQEMRKQLNFFKNRKIYKWDNCNLISYISGISFEKMIIIDCGEKDGISEGLGVVSGDGVFIGKITKVYPNRSFVRIITDSKSKIDATVLNSTKSRGVLEGKFGAGVELTLIPRDEEITGGQLVITTGDALIPKGLIIGTVEVSERDKTGVLQTAVINPILNLNRLLIVGVIKAEDGE